MQPANLKYISIFSVSFNCLITFWYHLGPFFTSHDTYLFDDESDDGFNSSNEENFPDIQTSDVAICMY